MLYTVDFLELPFRFIKNSLSCKNTHVIDVHMSITKVNCLHAKYSENGESSLHKEIQIPLDMRINENIQCTLTIKNN